MYIVLYPYPNSTVMDRRQFIVRSAAAAAGALLPFNRLIGAQPANFRMLRRNVGIFTERGGTIAWLAADAGMAVVDSQYPESAGHCLDGLRERSSGPLQVLLNTHHHGDHTAGNTIFKPVAATTAAHRAVPLLMQRAAGEQEEAEQPAYPETTYTDSWKTQVGDETIHATHFGPAHTGGDSVVYFEKANVVHMGDLVFNRMNPYTDRPAGASVHNWINVLNTTAEHYPADAIYVFGHGKPEYGVTGSRQDLAVMGAYLSAMVEYVEQGVRAGRSKTEITDLRVLDGFEQFLYADFWTLSQNLEVVYQEVTGKKWLEVS